MVTSEGGPVSIQTWGTWRNIYPMPFTGVLQWDNRARVFRSVLWHRNESPVRRINGDLYSTTLDEDHARPSSMHPGGVVAAFCDDHVTFINQSIDYPVYRQLMTSHGNQAFANGSDPDNREFNDAHF
jgi:hypothetical protein